MASFAGNPRQRYCNFLEEVCGATIVASTSRQKIETTEVSVHDEEEKVAIGC
jgi:hypothetical protein